VLSEIYKDMFKAARNTNPIVFGISPRAAKPGFEWRSVVAFVWIVIVMCFYVQSMVNARADWFHRLIQTLWSR
jgi:hypothetical protein